MMPKRANCHMKSSGELPSRRSKTALKLVKIVAHCGRAVVAEPKRARNTTDWGTTALWAWNTIHPT